MIHSIRQKLFLSISLLIIFFVVFSWVLNTHYLERYYVSQKSAQLHDYAREIETLINQQPEDLFPAA